MPVDTLLPQRKNDHLRINLEEKPVSHLQTGLERFRLLHTALPELDFASVETSASFLGFSLRAPLLISSMTGGTDQAKEINKRLAAAANAHGIAIGAGSQRAALEEPAAENSFSIIRENAPDTLVFANLGAVQLNYGYGVESCQQVVDMLKADGLFLHLNPLQEALQPEGDTNFSGLLNKIGRVCRVLEVPVMIKEVGWGIDVHTARQLLEAGVSAIDCSGAGGTSWSEVEKYRTEDSVLRRNAAAFQDWGHPTADLLISLRSEFPDVPFIASGGIRNGVDATKCIALGANLVGAARPFLIAAAHSPERVMDEIGVFTMQLRTAMFVTGCRTIAELGSKPVIERIQ